MTQQFSKSLMELITDFIFKSFIGFGALFLAIAWQVIGGPQPIQTAHKFTIGVILGLAAVFAALYKLWGMKRAIKDGKEAYDYTTPFGFVLTCIIEAIWIALTTSGK